MIWLLGSLFSNEWIAFQRNESVKIVNHLITFSFYWILIGKGKNKIHGIWAIIIKFYEHFCEIRSQFIWNSGFLSLENIDIFMSSSKCWNVFIYDINKISRATYWCDGSYVAAAKLHCLVNGNFMALLLI